jgi:hypothetical protein
MFETSTTTPTFTPEQELRMWAIEQSRAVSKCAVDLVVNAQKLYDFVMGVKS